MSRWMIFSSWRYFNPAVASVIHWSISNSENFFPLFWACSICFFKSPFLNIRMKKSHNVKYYIENYSPRIIHKWSKNNSNQRWFHRNAHRKVWHYRVWCVSRVPLRFFVHLIFSPNRSLLIRARQANTSASNTG